MTESDTTHEDDVPGRLDISEYDTPEDAARALYEYLKDFFDNPSSLYLWSPVEAAPRRDGHAAWTVSYEGGPFEWAKALTAGESMIARELGRYGGGPEVTGWHDQDNWLAQPYHSFDLQFHEQ